MNVLPCPNSAVCPPTVMEIDPAPYEETWAFQRSLQRKLIDGSGQEYLLICQHPPVITLGKSAHPDNVISTREQLAADGIKVVEVERGGDVTFHGPGQIVVYPILDLRKHRTDVGWYMRTLEKVVISTLQQIGIEACTREGQTGVWMPSRCSEIKELSPDRPRKIASIGVRISRWCTMHGFSLNCSDVRRGFTHIHPCGFHDIEITSIEQELADREGNPPSLSAVKSLLIERFCETFGYGRG